MKKYGLVLSGGGTKGAFEIGVWQALREMKIHTPCVIGTSVGALNAAVIAQNDFDKALDFWSNLTINQVLNLNTCLLYTSPSPRDRTRSRMPSSA